MAVTHEKHVTVTFSVVQYCFIGLVQKNDKIQTLVLLQITLLAEHFYDVDYLFTSS